MLHPYLHICCITVSLTWIISTSHLSGLFLWGSFNSRAFFIIQCCLRSECCFCTKCWWTFVSSCPQPSLYIKAVFWPYLHVFSPLIYVMPSMLSTFPFFILYSRFCLFIWPKYFIFIIFISFNSAHFILSCFSFILSCFRTSLFIFYFIQKFGYSFLKTHISKSLIVCSIFIAKALVLTPCSSIWWISISISMAFICAKTILAKMPITCLLLTVKPRTINTTDECIKHYTVTALIHPWSKLKHILIIYRLSTQCQFVKAGLNFVISCIYL